ncbi:MAG: hypothetical protein HKUEN01_22370 [Candidatus Kuenenia stuttgartiensis]|nr:MAG: hypothetical protein HKUEN01_22370 [Candidatus Kuenenia stuttgartiensis]
MQIIISNKSQQTRRKKIPYKEKSIEQQGNSRICEYIFTIYINKDKGVTDLEKTAYDA